MLGLIGGIFDTDALLGIMVFSIPIVAIIGGITAGIVKTMSDARLVENAQRERLAAIQRGADLDKLPPLPAFGQSASEILAGFDHVAAQRHRAQGLLIGGIITLFAGVGLMAFLSFLSDEGDRVWAVGIVPAFVGVALLLSAWIVWPRGKSGTGTGTGTGTGA